jgi:hypothetical protein
MKSRQSKTSSPFWKPSKEGETCEGKFQYFSETQTPDGKKGMAIKVGQWLVPMSHQVKSAIVPVISKLKEGKTSFKFVFIEKKKVKKGRTVNVVSVFMDGKELESHTFKHLTPAEAMKALNDQDEK